MNHPQDYDDIIHLSRPIIPGHPPMSRSARAAQFSPYAALVGHKDLITQTETTTLTQGDPDHIIIPDFDPSFSPDEDYL